MTIKSGLRSSFLISKIPRPHLLKNTIEVTHFKFGRIVLEKEFLSLAGGEGYPYHGTVKPWIHISSHNSYTFL